MKKELKGLDELRDTAADLLVSLFEKDPMLPVGGIFASGSKPNIDIARRYITAQAKYTQELTAWENIAESSIEGHK